MAIAARSPRVAGAPLHRRMLDALEAWPSADPAVLAHHAVGRRAIRERILRHATDGRPGGGPLGRAHPGGRVPSDGARRAARRWRRADEAELLESLAEPSAT